MAAVFLSAGATPARATAWVQMPGGLVLSDDGSKTFINAPVPAGNPAAQQPADLKACACGWTAEITYHSPSEIPVPDSVVVEWKRLPLTDDRTVAALTTAYQRKAWKQYLKGLTPCARAALERRTAQMESAGRTARDLQRLGYDPV
jgi:hypothetical protein